MKSYQVKRYQNEDYSIWNTFVAKAKNATFLFHRDFMDYHKARFEDYSLLIFDEKDNLKAILPANRVGETIFSHQGLTYGGLVTNYSAKLSEVINIFRATLSYLHIYNISQLNLKSIPNIYNDFPSDELEYMLFILDAKKTRCDTLSVIDLKTQFKISTTRKQEIKKTKELVIEEVTDFNLFWNTLLLPNLEEKHAAKPVHTLQEIKLLHSKFPKNIRQFNVYFKNELIAGTTIFETENVAHCQYISGLSKFNNLGGLDFLQYHLIKNVFADKKYYDFGTSNENEGNNINTGLLFWKESFGARTLVQNFYTIETKNYSNLENILL